MAASEHSHLSHLKAKLKDRLLKRLAIYGRKTHSTVTLPMRVANRQILLSKYNCINFTVLARLPEKTREQFMALKGTSQQKHPSTQLLMQLIQPCDLWPLSLP